VEIMVNFGAVANKQEMAEITEYLSRTYPSPPKTPSATR
jgi:hypothetical protein